MYEAKNFNNLLGVPGFSDELLTNHFTLYQGYVKNVNMLNDELDLLLRQDKTGTPAYAELMRRFGWEFNGMRLHELYFGNMINGGIKLSDDSSLMTKIKKAYSSYENWEKDFRAVAVMRGIGWAVLYHDPESNQVLNVWVNEHDVGHLATCKPLLILDVFEHAYVTDYGIKRADYIEAFFKAINWPVAEKRLI